MWWISGSGFEPWFTFCAPHAPPESASPQRGGRAKRKPARMKKPEGAPRVFVRTGLFQLLRNTYLGLTRGVVDS